MSLTNLMLLYVDLVELYPFANVSEEELTKKLGAIEGDQLYELNEALKLREISNFSSYFSSGIIKNLLVGQPTSNLPYAEFLSFLLHNTSFWSDNQRIQELQEVIYIIERDGCEDLRTKEEEAKLEHEFNPKYIVRYCNCQNYSFNEKIFDNIQRLEDREFRELATAYYLSALGENYELAQCMKIAADANDHELASYCIFLLNKTNFNSAFTKLYNISFDDSLKNMVSGEFTQILDFLE